MEQRVSYGLVTDAVEYDIMVVDDTPTNLQLLVSMLRSHAYKVRPVLSGRLALKAARSARPDLILLDIDMPEMDGYEVCARLKSTAGLEDVPVIFISALNEPFDKVRAFGAGGVDYISKPFQFEEVEARIKAHLRMAGLQRELAGRLEELTEAQAMRDSLVHMIVHDMRSPLTGMQLLLEVVHRKPAVGDDPQTQAQVARVLAHMKRLTSMTNDLLDVSKAEAGGLSLGREPRDVVGLLEAAARDHEPMARDCDVRVTTAGPLVASIDPNLIQRVVDNLLGNALKVSPAGGAVLLGATRDDGTLRVTVSDEGPGIPLAEQERIFDKFRQLGQPAEQPCRSVGLGLAFCRMVVDAHGGAIGVESQPGMGARFWFELPVGE